MTLIIDKVLLSCYVHIFSEVIYHFPSTGTWKSDVAKYMRGDRYMKFYENRASYIFSIITVPRQARGNMMLLSICEVIDMTIYEHRASYTFSVITFPRQARGKVMLLSMCEVIDI